LRAKPGLDDGFVIQVSQKFAIVAVFIKLPAMLSNLSVYGVSKTSDRHTAVIVWLIIIAVLVFAMVVLGGVTRLTNSGLSMTDWKPLTGWLPPLTEAAWQLEFENYKSFPEYQKINKGMSLAEFKNIFAFEFSHRLFGRIIGLVFFLPFIYFLVMGKIKGAMIPRMTLLFLLGGAQGLMGWIMVKSGLVDDPDVSHYRLTAHLGLACVIYSLAVWSILDLLRPAQGLNRENLPSLRLWSRLALLAMFIQLLIGGFVAGLDGGFIYNDWPLMGGEFMPDELFFMSPWYWNILENPATIQFVHRMVAYLVTILVLYLVFTGLRQNISSRVRNGLLLLLTMVVLQIALGILTLTFVVPVALGAAHQAGGLVVLTFGLLLTHELSEYR
jgi:heme a synthase